MSLFDPLCSIRMFGLEIDIVIWTLFGLIGSVLFSGRVLIQWIASERAKKSVVPVSFWWMSLAATLIASAYALGVHKNVTDALGRTRRIYDPDLPMFIGLSVTIVPYLRNLRIHYRPDRPARTGLQILLPVCLLIGAAIVGLALTMPRPNWPIFLFGLAGTAVNSSRFLVAWVKTESERKAVLPLSFWYISAVGSLMLLAYSLLREDLVFILSFLFNTIPQVRNIVMIQRERKAEEARSI
jgi:lipid-A-disaccharide synthase-like uncharacterized protein